MWKRILFLSVIMLFAVGTSQAKLDLSTWQGQWFQNGTLQSNTTGNFDFNIYNNESGGTLCYSNNTNLTTGEFGQWYVQLENVSSSCTNAESSYWVEIKIDGLIQPPRRLLSYFNFLRKDVNETTTGNFTASNFFGYLNWSWLKNVPTFLTTELEPLWNGNYSLIAFKTDYYNKSISDNRFAPIGYGDDWNKSFADTLYYNISNPLNFINQTQADILYYSTTNPNSYYNSSTLPTYPTPDNTSWNQSMANNLYYNISNPNNYYNSTTIPAFALISDLVSYVGNWSADKTNYVTTTIFNSIGNWTADRSVYINTTRAWTNDTNIGISGDTISWIGTLADGRIASAGTWNGKAGTGNCPAGQVVMNTTTSGVQCIATVSGGTVNQTIITATGLTTWVKPAGTTAKIQIWGGGASGGCGGLADAGGGGGGGGYNEMVVPLSDLGDTENCTVGSGGARVTGDVIGNAGGTTSFTITGTGKTVYAYGGGAGYGGTAGDGGGGGGGGVWGVGQPGLVNAGGLGGIGCGALGVGTPVGAWGDVCGGGGGTTKGGSADWGGGGGGYGQDTGTAYGGGNSVFGGGGGAGGDGAGVPEGVAGTSIWGGDGGAGATAGTSAENGTQPGGAGGGAECDGAGVYSGKGGDGMCIITVW